MKNLIISAVTFGAVFFVSRELILAVVYLYAMRSGKEALKEAIEEVEG